MLRLPWLQDVNPNINWKNLAMQFSSPKASLAAAIPLHLQSILDSDIHDSNTSTSRATQSPSTLDGLQYPDQQCPTLLNNPATTPDPAAATLSLTSIDPGDLNIRILGTVPFACILQDGTPTFQLQIMPALLEEYLCTQTTLPEHKTEEQILYKVVPPEYHGFTDVFSEGSAKELSPHCSYNHKIDLEEGASPPFGKIYNMSKIKLWALKNYLDNMLSKGFICLSISAAGTPVLFAKKKDGSL
ncbi:hypothetical protein E4T56_gene8701 [Termitomyces sp. T112]|nr:hypothetical protein E4T56_gene8701 [Termitomyces sp. T112]